MGHSPESHVGRTPWSAADALVGLGGCRRPARPGGRARARAPAPQRHFHHLWWAAGPWGTPLKITLWGRLAICSRLAIGGVPRTTTTGGCQPPAGYHPAPHRPDRRDPVGAGHARP